MAQKLISPNVDFTVRRQEPELIHPSKPTPLEHKLLSDIDDQHGLRFHLPFIHFYRNKNNNRDPVKVIREALADVLVFYYPLAGRLREVPGEKLVVECTGEGVLFIEADADVRMEEFGDQLYPPFPSLDEFLYNVPGSHAMLNSPLLLIQVTRLLCGGFVFALRINHTLTDSSGLLQFMVALGEIARGATTLSVQPLWQRELLNATDPPHVTCDHPEYDPTRDTFSTLSWSDVDHRSFSFGPREFSILRKLVPKHLSNCSRFEVLTACLWRCRTIALQLEPDEEVSVLCAVDSRYIKDMSLPLGYYGNAIAFPAAVSTVTKLSKNSLEYALELIMNAKSSVTCEYMRSLTNLMVTKGRPHLTVSRTWMATDITKAGFSNVDLGWGKANYAAVATGRVSGHPGMVSPYVPFRNIKGENLIVVPICLTPPAMERFVEVLNSIFMDKDQFINTSPFSQTNSKL